MYRIIFKQELKNAEELESEDREAQAAVRRINLFHTFFLIFILLLETSGIDSSRNTKRPGGCAGAHENNGRRRE